MFLNLNFIKIVNTKVMFLKSILCAEFEYRKLYLKTVFINNFISISKNIKKNIISLIL